MKIFKLTYFIACIAMLNSHAQTKEELKKKYENSSAHEETMKKGKTNNIYPDSIILAPLHYTNSFYFLDKEYSDFNKISIDVEICNDIPKNYNFYISPLNFSLNGIMLYGGIQTKGGGKNIKTGINEGITYNAIFSRWYERTNKALKTNGFYESSDHEGDFIGIRDTINWNKGKYRLTLKKEKYIKGTSIKDVKNPKDLYFSWGDYEHSWVGYYVENLETKQIFKIGELAFPGKKLKLSNYLAIFTEQYGKFIDFSSTGRKAPNYIHMNDLPYVRLVFSNIYINDNLIKPNNVETYHNKTHHPEQNKIPAKMPILSTANYDSNTGNLTIETGKFIKWGE